MVGRAFRTMEIRSVFQTAKREWDNISISLELCGEIGEFELVHYIESKPELIRSLIGMEKKIHDHDYLTRDAAFVFAELVSEAVRRLGLNPNLANTFGGGYSWVRTGWFDLVGLDFDNLNNLEERLTQEIFFFRLFYPSREDYGWLFDSPSTVSSFKYIYDKFRSWQSDPVGYDRDIKLYKTEIDPIWEGLTAALDVQYGQC